MAGINRDDPLPYTNHVARYCKPMCVDEGMVLASAFVPGENEAYLSVNWMEYYPGDIEEQIGAIKSVFDRKEYKVRKNGRFAVVGISKALKAVRTRSGKSINFIFLPEQDDPSHSGISSYSHEDLAVSTAIHSTLIAADVFNAIP